MKKILLTLIVGLLLPMVAHAQLDIVPGSFHNSNRGASTASGTSLGQQDLTNMTIDWPLDEDGNDNAALLRVFFENFPPQEVGNVTPSLSSGAIVISKSERTADNGNHFLMVFIPAKKNMDVTFTHPKYGSVRQSGANFDKHQVYDITLRNKTTVTVNINSNPIGAEVLFDGKNVGRTPLKMEDVTLGAHMLEMRTPDQNIADGLSQRTIEVTEAKNLFEYDLRRQFRAVFKADPHDASLRLLQNGATKIDWGKGQIEGYIPAGEYVVEGRIGTVNVSTPVSISNGMSFPVTVQVVPTKTVSFIALQNNLPVQGATIDINGKTYGQTPMDIPLKYGDYHVQMMYSGVSKSGTLKVNDKSGPAFELKLPNRQHRAHNPFSTYYKKREWGIAVDYINKWYTFKDGKVSDNYDMWSDEKTMNGVQAGISYQPYFGYGQGLSTGLYWQGFFGTVDFIDGGTGDYQEHSIYIPLQYQFRLPLGEEFSIALKGGIGVSYGVSNTIKIDGESFDVGYGYNEEFETYMPKAFQLSVPLGVGIQFKAMQFEFKYSIGLTDNDDMYIADEGDNCSFKQNYWSAGLTLLF